jgi:hypothetical protein
VKLMKRVNLMKSGNGKDRIIKPKYKQFDLSTHSSPKQCVISDINIEFI